MFTFTLVREPLSFALSFFNMFHAPKNRYSWNPFDLYEPTEANLRKSLIPNRQCLILALAGDGTHKNTIPSSNDCYAVKSMLINDLDWVGTTEHMQEETLPLLTHLLLHNASTGKSMPYFRPTVEPRRSLSLKNLSLATKEYILEHSGMDIELYHAVLETEQRRRWRTFATSRQLYKLC